MEIENKKNIWLFYLIAGLFVLIVALTTFIYSKFDDQVEPQGVEVNLPIIEWGTYTELSKKHKNGIIE